jgi:hypothetical protein
VSEMPTGEDIVVFVGPCIPHEEVRVLLGDEIALRPPVRRGDFDRLPPEVRVVGLIDGVFHQTEAVSPREILNAVRRGVRVIGSSSMGALRAADLAGFGMEGVGEIYEMYVDGRIVSDAEVALAFDPDTLKAITEPLVNIRYMLARAESENVVTRSQSEALLSAATEVHFCERSVPMWLHEAEKNELLDKQVIERLRRFLQDQGEELNLKKHDALRLIDRLKRTWEEAKNGSSAAQ